MAKYRVLDMFYKSDDWISFRKAYIIQRMIDDHGTDCDYCGQSIDQSADIALHHVEELTPDNVRDVYITMNPENIKQVHRGCHNTIHKHSADAPKKVYIVYGPPMSGKDTYVNKRKWPGDLIVNMDDLYQAISGRTKYDKPDILYNNVIGVYDFLIDNISTRYGRWDNAWIVGGYADKYKRERLAKQIGADVIYIEASYEECIARLTCDPLRSKRVKEWSGYIKKWFDTYTK